MKLFSAIFILLIPMILISQRVDIPKDNSGNHLDLKLVYQLYTATTHNSYGHQLSSRKDSLFLLKVNGAYYSHKETGVSKSVFNNYLKECPDALSIGNSGFNLYNRGKKSSTIANVLKFVGSIGTIVYGIKYINSKNSSDLIVGMGFLAGFGTSYYFRNRSNSLYKQADLKILDAIESYRTSCFEPLANSTFEDGLEHGVNNSDENIFLTYYKNDARSWIVNMRLSAAIASYSNFNYGLSGSALIAKSGFSLSGNLFNNKFSTDLSQNDGYEWNVLGSIPVVRSIKKRKLKLAMGKALGLEMSGPVEGISRLSSLNVDGGIQKIYTIGEASSQFDVFSYNTAIKRAGISYNLFMFLKYKINDNRFSPKMRYNLLYLKIYTHALLNMDTNHELINPSILSQHPEFNKHGGALGVDMIYSKQPYGAFNIKLEGGQYSYTGNTRFDFITQLGVSLYLAR